MPMKATLNWDRELLFSGADEENRLTWFASKTENDPTPRAASPMQAMLQAAAACSAIDVVDILKKRRKTLTALQIHATAERADSHPRVFTAIHFVYEVTGPDLTEKEVNRAIELSLTKYCSATNTLRNAGVDLTWEALVQAD